MTHKDFFLFESTISFSKTTENEAVKMTDIKNGRVHKQSLHLLQNILLLHYSVVVKNRRKTKSAAVNLVLQPAYYKNLPIEDKKKADILYLLRKNHIPKIYATFYESLFQ
jgi:hypothetical protein